MDGNSPYCKYKAFGVEICLKIAGKHLSYFDFAL